MKRQILMLLAAMLLTCCSEDSDITAQNAQHTQNAGKTLVVYYSYTNNCHEIVQTLTSQIEADVMRIEPADKTQKYEANNYAIGTQLLNAIQAAPNDAASYPAIDPVSITDLSEHHHRHTLMVESDGSHFTDLPLSSWCGDGRQERWTDSVECQQRHQRCGKRLQASGARR